jgi:hypothetical protein
MVYVFFVRAIFFSSLVLPGTCREPLHVACIASLLQGLNNSAWELRVCNTGMHLRWISKQPS